MQTVSVADDSNVVRLKMLISTASSYASFQPKPPDAAAAPDKDVGFDNLDGILLSSQPVSMFSVESSHCFVAEEIPRNLAGLSDRKDWVLNPMGKRCRKMQNTFL